MTEFKPGDRVRVAFDLELDADCEVKLDLSGYWPVWQLAERTGVYVTRLTAEPAVPYTDPRKGDKVALTLTGTLTGQSPCDEVDHSVEADCVQLWEFREDGTDTVRRVNPAAFGDGRVTLIERAAAPQYQPGCIYHSNSARSNFLRVDSEDGEYWMAFNDDGELVLWGDTQPNDLVPCDVVPAQVSS